MSLDPAAASSTLQQQVEAVRRFGRFYTRFLGVLREHLLDSPFSLTEARVIYELAHRVTADLGTLTAALSLDSGYMSRLMGRLEQGGILTKTRSPDDKRVKLLSLTERGQRSFADLDDASARQVERALHALDPADRPRLIRAMETIEDLLGVPVPDRVPYMLRPHQPGDLGWVVQRHGIVYADEYNWNTEFEGLVAEIVGAFARNFDHQRERCWIAEKDGENVGSVFLVKKSDEVAQLRLLLVDSRARGLGIGGRLVQECTRFGRQAGYRSIVLWTNSVLDSARRIYESEGYRLIREEPHHSFGHDLVGQYWELAL